MEWRDRRGGVCVTDADVSICQPHAEKASGFVLRQTQDGVCRPLVRCVCRPGAWFGALCTASIAAIDAGGFGVGRFCHWGVDRWNVERAGHVVLHALEIAQ
jgi:hypothetical protein